MHPRYSSNEHVHKMFSFEGILHGKISGIICFVIPLLR